jgi:hypothetical protein
MRVKRAKTTNGDGLVMEVKEKNKDEDWKEENNEIGNININVLHEFLNHVGENRSERQPRSGDST